MTKKCKAGFTLIELMGIIIILSLLSLLVIPGIDHAIKQFKDEAYEGQLKNIKLAATDWTIDNVPKYALNDGDAITITLAQLKMSNLVEEDITNPKTDAPFADDMIINIIRQNNSFSFDVDSDSGVIAGLSDNAPVLTLNGDYVVRMYENYGYVDQGATAKTSTGVAIPSTSITKIITKNGTVVPSITDMVGTYTISYSVTHSGITRMIYRVIVFEQLEPFTPELCFTFNAPTQMITDYDYLNPNCPSKVIIPRSIGGVSVIAIGNSAFIDNFLTKVTIPSSVTSLGTYAFSNNELTDIVIPNSLSSIPAEAFSYNQLSSLTIPTSIVTIGSSAFGHNFITSLTIPSNVTTINSSAFSYNNLSSLTLNNGLTTIGVSAFNTNLLTSVTIPNTVTSLGIAAFQNNLLTSVSIPSSITSIQTATFDDNLLTSVTIPTSITTIEGSAFSSNRLTSVVIPNSVTSIGGYAFRFNDLASLTLGSNIVSIGNDAFYDNNLTSLTIPNSVTSIGNYAFYFNLIAGGIVIPNGVTTIGEGTFEYNRLTSITLPSGITSIGDYAFNANSLTAIDLSANINNIGVSAFNSNRILQGSAIIRRASGSVTIGAGAFANNTATGSTTITPTYIP